MQKRLFFSFPFQKTGATTLRPVNFFERLYEFCYSERHILNVEKNETFGRSRKYVAAQILFAKDYLGFETSREGSMGSNSIC